ncbi:MAG: hydantoinase B/oxoprolinase family protein [Solirubrobacterales bacterium]
MDPVTLQVMVGALRAACEEMGAALIRSAHSANITERRDCSTALFDARGELVMQAEHIPVHLGSMPDAVAAIIPEEQAEGDLWILNDPYRGGTHLPDITLISPAFAAGELVGFAASRAHHADVGGPTPASMPADSVTLDEEGVVISPRRADDAALREIAARMRNPDQRLADLRAQRAANLLGIRRLRELVARDGIGALRAGMDAILAYAERRTRAALAALPDGQSTAADALEWRGREVPLRLRATLTGERLVLDFEGSAEQVEGNLNCPLSVTRSACFYAVRVAFDPDGPPSAGAWRPVEVRAPEGSLLRARAPAAVAAGNVETSSRVADVVFEALAAFTPLPAAGQGTMNNLTFAGTRRGAGVGGAVGDRGDAEWTYYETIGGGQGASESGDGPSGVHVGMSNTLNTPIEALELEYPMRVEGYELRDGSGGEGQHRGGDGVERAVLVLEPATLNLLTDRRRHAPEGREGGGDGACGENLLNDESLPPKATRELVEGDVVVVRTPGGGGYGTAG